MKKDKLTPMLVGIANTMFVICIVFLLTTSLFSTVYMTDETKIYFVSDSILRNLIFIVLGLVIGYLVYKYWISVKGELSNKKFLSVKWGIISLVELLSVIWIISNQVIPGADQYELQKAAAEIYSGNYAAFEPGGYLDRIHYLCGYVLVILIFTPIVGTYNYMFWMMLNAVCLIPLFCGACRICNTLKIEKKRQIVFMTAFLFFVPIILYTTFPYGNILGLTCVVWMIYNSILFLNDHKVYRLPIVFVLFFFGNVFKGPYVIWGVAIGIYAIYLLIKKKNLFGIFLIIIIVLAYLSYQRLPLEVFRMMTGYDINQGEGVWPHLSMGFQEGGAAPGWWNGYNWYTYEGNGFNKEATDYVSKIVLRKRCAEFYHNIPYAFKFFWQKLASEWNNPTFQGFYYNSVREISNERCGIVDWILSNKGVHLESICLKFVQVNTLFGSLLYGLKKKKTDEDIRKMLFPIIFIGAFAFFTLWEAQAQNT